MLPLIETLVDQLQVLRIFRSSPHVALLVRKPESTEKDY